jgi:hypothetical protein
MDLGSCNVAYVVYILVRVQLICMCIHNQYGCRAYMYLLYYVWIWVNVVVDELIGDR